MQEREKPPSPCIRPASPEDSGRIVEMIRELADYERLTHVCRAEPVRLAEHLCGASRHAEVVLADWEGSPAAFALFFHTFSTFECAPSLYLEDLFVRPPFRRRGIGRALLRHLAGLAVDRGCRRMEWAVLDWNQSAVDFYLELGARAMDEWTVFRLDGEALRRMAGGARG